MTALDINTIVNWSRAVDRLTAEHEAHKRNIEATGERIRAALRKYGDDPVGVDRSLVEVRHG